MNPLYIESVSTLLCEVEESSSHLKKELERTSGEKFRRVNHFCLLALAGIFRLPNLRNTDAECALYVGTKNGCVRDVVKMLKQMYTESLLPMPFTFLGTSTGMAGFYISQTLGLRGANITVSNPNGAFEHALSMACMDMEMKKTTSALIGCVDEGVYPLDLFKKAIGYCDDMPLLEGGCWLKLTVSCNDPLAMIYAKGSFKTFLDVQSYLSAQSFEGQVTVIAEEALSIDEQASLLEALPMGAKFGERHKESRYVGFVGGIDYVRTVQEQRSGVAVLIYREGRIRFGVLLTRLLG